MVDQTTMKMESSPASGNGVGIVGGVADFGNNVVTLCELQAKLTALDLKECSGKVAWPIIFVVVALIVVISAVTVGLFGLAEVMAKSFALSQGLAMILTSLSAIVVAASIGLISTWEIKSSIAIFRRSNEEFARNLAWLRTVLVHSGRPSTKRTL